MTTCFSQLSRPRPASATTNEFGGNISLLLCQIGRRLHALLDESMALLVDFRGDKKPPAWKQTGTTERFTGTCKATCKQSQVTHSQAELLVGSQRLTYSSIHRRKRLKSGHWAPPAVSSAKTTLKDKILLLATFILHRETWDPLNCRVNFIP